MATPPSRCNRCRVTFASVGGFDAHLEWSEKQPFTKHLHPASIGMVQNERGYWGWFDAPTKRITEGSAGTDQASSRSR